MFFWWGVAAIAAVVTLWLHWTHWSEPETVSRREKRFPDPFLFIADTGAAIFVGITTYAAFAVY